MRTEPKTQMNAPLDRRALLKLASAGAVTSSAGWLTHAFAAPPYQLRATALSSQRIPVQSVIDKFVAKYAGSSVNLAAMDVDQLYTTTRVSLSAGNAAEILTVQPGNGNPITIGQLGKFIGDLSGFSFASKIPGSLS